MNLAPLGLAAAPLPCAIPAVRIPVSSGQVLVACRLAWEQGARLCALWLSDERDRDAGFCLRIVLQDSEGFALLEHTLPDASTQYPDIAAIFPAANRMQRAAFDLCGVASESDDQRPWLWMASWPIDRFPLQRDFEASPKWEPGEENYPFVRVDGDGVHEIPVGPVHAGVIEPGHFRFSVVGEKVLRLEERLGYTHKGIEKRFTQLAPLDAHRLAGRVSGDSTVAYAWAYCMALEAAADCAISPRARWLRALLLERERVAQHLGDLGALGNDAALTFGLAQFSRLREDWLRVSKEVFGHRLMMDSHARGVADRAPRAANREKAMSERESFTLANYDEHEGLQDRFRACGIVRPRRR